ncbi:tilB protein [Pelomyxa schiedti]|nr:tilB protein [Pelomyxa schiedti]
MRITGELLRRQAGDNEELSNLQEIALHQLHIEGIDGVLGQMCPRLRVLLLQDNVIPKLENLHRLKELNYLNLALNNITLVENLEGCESLRKLDLTANFIADIKCLSSLKGNHNLRQLFLIGNPCTQLPYYRNFIISCLPQLVEIDGIEITPSERILASQSTASIDSILCSTESSCNAEPLRSGDTPESRKTLHLHLEQIQNEVELKRNPPPHPSEPPAITFRPDGSIVQMNQGRWQFTLGSNPAGNCLLLDVAFEKYMDTSLISVDCQPKYVRITAKKKVLQLNLPEEISPGKGKAERSQTTGHLLLTLPKVHFTPVPTPASSTQGVLHNPTARGTSTTTGLAVSLSHSRTPQHPTTAAAITTKSLVPIPPDLPPLEDCE